MNTCQGAAAGSGLRACPAANQRLWAGKKWLKAAITDKCLEDGAGRLHRDVPLTGRLQNSRKADEC